MPNNATTGLNPAVTLNSPVVDGMADKESKAETGKLVWNYTNNGTLPNLAVDFFKPGSDLARQGDDKETVKDLKDQLQEKGETQSAEELVKFALKRMAAGR